MQNRDELHNDDLSSDDDHRRRRGTVKAFTLDEVPMASGFREFVQKTYVKVMAASKGSKLRILKWLREVASCANVAELENPGSGRDDLDTALADAVFGIAKGPLKKEICLYGEERTRKGQSLAGRAALLHLYQSFKLDRCDALSIDLSTLLQLKIQGDLEGFLAAWDYTLMALKKPMTTISCSHCS